MQLDVELGEENVEENERHRNMMNIVHYTMRYTLKDGSDMSDDAKTFATEVLGHVVIHTDATDVAKAAAYHMMAIIEMDNGHIDNSMIMEMAAREAINRGMVANQYGMDYV